MHFILDIEPRAALDQELDHVAMSGESGLMKRRRMRMRACGVEAVGVFTGVE